MSRHPRDPRDPFDDLFNDRNGSSSWDPFNDPFFKQFEQMHEHIFRDFFGVDDRSSSIFIQHPNSTPNSHDKEPNAPDLSQINPNAPASNPNNDKREYSQHPHVPPSLFRTFRHFFEPEYDEHKLSDINPNISDNEPIMKNDKDNKGLIHPNEVPRGFRSPYLPNSNGAEKNLDFNANHRPQRFYRSQSVVISTGSDGRTTKTTTIRDSNGEHITTEEYDGDKHGFNNEGMNDIQSMFNNIYNNNAVELFQNEKVPLFERTHDPFARFRSKWQNWKWNPYNWYNKENNYDDNNVNKIEWKSYKDFNSTDDKKGPSLLDDIVKKKD